MKINKLYIKFLIFLFINISTIFIYVDLKYNNEILVYSTNIIILLLSSFFMVFGDKYNFSLNKLFYLFSYFFFGVAPILQYTNNITFWKKDIITGDEYLKLNIIIIIIILFYQLFYFIFNNFKINFIERFILKKISLKNRKLNRKFLIINSFLVLLLSFYMVDYNLKNLFFNTPARIEILNRFSQVYMLIYNNFIRIIPFISIFIFKMYKINNKKEEVFLVILFILTNFPTTMPRYAVARVYIPFFLIYFKILRNFFVLNLITCFGLLYIFPFLNQFRVFKMKDNIKYNLDFSMFIDGHFDSYQNFLRVISNNIVTNGNQLLGVFFFYIPRSLWKNKPVGSGEYLSKKISLEFDNIAMNYFGEGYINFGYIGIFIFLIVLAYINSRFDLLYWKYLKEDYLSIVYFFLIGLEFFILRGDLMSSYAYAIGSILSSLFLYVFLLNKKN